MGFFLRHDGCDGLLLYYASRPAAFHVANATTRRRAALPAPLARTVLSVLLFDPYISQRFKVLCFMGWRRWCAAMELFDSECGAGPGKMSSTAVWRVPMASSGSRLVSARAPGSGSSRMRGAGEWVLKHEMGIGDGVPGGSSPAITFQ